MLFKNAKIWAIALLAISSFSSQAAFQTGSWKTANDNQVMVDTSTGVEWLKLNNTKGKSIQYVLDNLKVGGVYQGWRLPTEAEVLALTAQFYGNTYGYNQDDRSYYTGNMYIPRGDSRQVQFNNWYNMMGSTYFADGSNAYEGGYWYDAYSTGVYLNADPGVGAQSSSILYAGMYTHRGGVQARDYMGAYSGYNTTSWSLTTVSSSTGVFLVSDGGLTYSSLQNPSLNQNNMAAPNQPPRHQTNASAGDISTNSALVNLTYDGSDYLGFTYKVNGGAAQTTTSNQITLTDLMPGTQYVIDYTAYNANGTSSTWSQTTFVTAQLPPPPPPPPAPVNGPASLLMTLFAGAFIARRKSGVAK